MVKGALKESETQRQEAQSQLEVAKQELQRKDETLREAEAKSQEASRCIKAIQQELEQEKAKNKVSPLSYKDLWG